VALSPPAGALDTGARGTVAVASEGNALAVRLDATSLPTTGWYECVWVAGGQSRSRAVGGAVVLGTATILGVLLTEQVASLARHGLALSAGVTLYVAASNLVPEFQAKRGWLTAAAFFGGAAGYFLTERILAGMIQL